MYFLVLKELLDCCQAACSFVSVCVNARSGLAGFSQGSVCGCKDILEEKG